MRFATEKCAVLMMKKGKVKQQDELNREIRKVSKTWREGKLQELGNIGIRNNQRGKRKMRKSNSEKQENCTKPNSVEEISAKE